MGLYAHAFTLFGYHTTFVAFTVPTFVTLQLVFTFSLFYIYLFCYYTQFNRWGACPTPTGGPGIPRRGRPPGRRWGGRARPLAQWGTPPPPHAT